MTPDAMRARWAACEANRDRLDACKRHKFEGDIPGIAGGVGAMFGQRIKCLVCGGEMRLEHVNQYIRGYEAHGGNGNDILPGWREEPPETKQNGRRFFKPSEN